MARNAVVAGDYEGKAIISVSGKVFIVLGGFKKLELNRSIIEEFELVDQESRKSATSAVGRAFVGSVLLGPVGLLAGITAKSKGTHTIAVQFKDGKRSLIEVNDKIYKSIVTMMF